MKLGIMMFKASDFQVDNVVSPTECAKMCCHKKSGAIDVSSSSQMY
jgi:hypothetical protein